MERFSSKEMDEGIRLANNKAVDFFKGGKTSGVICTHALKYIASYKGIRQAENNEKQIQVTCLMNIAKDKKEFEEYIKLSNPDIIPKRALK